MQSAGVQCFSFDTEILIPHTYYSYSKLHASVTNGIIVVCRTLSMLVKHDIICEMLTGDEL